MGPALVSASISPHPGAAIGKRVIVISAIACGIAVGAALIAQLLTHMIGALTSLVFYGEWAWGVASPAGNHLGWWVVPIPIAGAVLVGLMARYGSQAIRGHGIPEAMENVLFNKSRIPARMTILKPLSAVIAIGTGGPFGAEGPIIATGGALGSLVGQILRITTEERKTLLAAGAAAGMSATFGAPVSATLLAIELLLFEYRPRSVIPVALASVTANGMRVAFMGMGPAFDVASIAQPSAGSVAAYVLVGAVVGVGSVFVTKAIYWIEDMFEHLPIHWMWWPAIGAIPVGVVGVISPHTLGVGYDNIEHMVSGSLSGQALFALCIWKFVSWSFSLGSGTSGGTLAPLFTIGGGLGAAVAMGIAALFPGLGVDPRIGALVGMAAMFAGASRALLASCVFAFETTRLALGLLPLLGGCSAAYLVSCLLMKNSIMTEKIARRGVRVPAEYAADYLDLVLVKEVALRPVVSLRAADTLADARAFLTSGAPGADHQGFPILDAQGAPVGVLTRRDLDNPSVPVDTVLGSLVRRTPLTVSPSTSLREAGDAMVRARVGRLLVISDGALAGILTRSDILEAHALRLSGETHREGAVPLPRMPPLPHLLRRR
ncbi:MAG TPA: chloride channel protein [Kofleriaceae bacterium]|jgi:H+/Cl- antiporter ClcA